ncbi:MAG: D-lyxose/D-mannose family sugar isomerase [Spirochaetes bacterium]|nr:D-lyxose/D-mannose family sugar isomerase [Spirochaetota bacterium]
MKRSEINARMKAAREFFRSMNFFLPPWAAWTPEAWRRALEKDPDSISEIRENLLGWDLTDFGGGNFTKRGLLLFTIRNGNLKNGHPKSYAEKIMVVEDNQETPCHFHFKKMEDIINRGGGRLHLHCWPSGKQGERLDAPLRLQIDGVQRTVAAGEKISLEPGESITLEPGVYHRFYGAGRVLVGEVSRVNDDTCDNRFFEEVGRFPVVEEDEAALYPLATEVAAM